MQLNEWVSESVWDLFDRRPTSMDFHNISRFMYFGWIYVFWLNLIEVVYCIRVHEMMNTKLSKKKEIIK
jgi:hypothetical protein